MSIDSRSIGKVDGFYITATLIPDDTSPYDSDCYDEEQIKSYMRDEWSYVGTIVTASLAGVPLGSSSLWGSEYGLMPGVKGWISPLDGDGEDFINGYGPGLISEAIENAKVTLSMIIEEAADAAIGVIKEVLA